MARFMIIFGILLILFSVAFLIILLAGSEIEATGQYITELVCEPGETLDQKYRQVYDSDGRSTTTDFYCVDAEGSERDITGKMIAIIIGGFLASFLPGLFMTIIGANVLARRATNAWSSTFLGGQNLGNIQASTINLSSGRTQYNATSMQDVQEIMNHVFSQTGQGISSGGGSLADRLKQLDEARQQGLISQDEYDRTRQAILDSMDD